ncbi:MAG: hydrogenase iron-sulfur subunit [bacterium]
MAKKKRNNKLKIIVFCCHNALDNIETIRKLKDTSIRVNLLPCSSKIEVSHLLLTFEQGVDAVLVVGCQEGKCQFGDGNRIARGRVSYTKRLLNEIGLGEEKIEFFALGSGEGFLEAVEVMKERIATIGANPLKKNFTTETRRAQS